MKEQTYRNMVDAIDSVPFMKQYIIWFNRIVTGAVYLLYPALLVMLYFTKNDGLLPAVIIPGISFILLSVLRDRINSPRPYEVFDLKPIINKKTSGHSFPSRHIFCMFLIAATVFRYCPAAGLVIGLAGLGLAVTRVLGGVHFLRDVTAGALIGAGCGIIGFWLILPLFS